MATDLEKLVVQLSADFRAFEKGLARAQGVSARQFNAIERRASQLDQRLNAIGRSAAEGLIAPLSGIGAVLGVREIARYADTWTEAGNKIKAAAQIAGVHTRSLNDLKDGANAARTDLETYVDLYAKLIRSASDVAKSEQEVATATDVVTKAFKAGGASTQEQIAGILQLSQALGSGLLQGDELRSIRENAPLLAKAIADEFKTTIAGLKDLGAEGKITSDRVFKAILAAQKPIQSAFDATNATIKDAITQINNEFLAYIGNADSSAGASRKLVDALQFLATNFKEVSDVVVQFATIIIAALTGRAILGMVAGLGNAVVALGAFLTALRAGTVAAASFTAALGPIGLIAGAAAAAIYLLYDAHGDARGSASSFNVAIQDNERALQSATTATYGQIDALRQLIAVQLEAARTAAQQGQADWESALNRRNQFRGAFGGRDFEPFRFAEEEANKRLGELQYTEGLLEEQLARTDELLKNKPSGYGKGTGAASPGSGSKSKSDPYERDVERVIAHTAALVAETEAQRQLNPLVDDYGYAAEKARMERDLLTAAEEAGKTVTPELRAEIAALAEQYAIAGAESLKLAEDQDELRQSMEDFRDLGKDVLGGFISDLEAGTTATEALGNALRKIGDYLLEGGLDALFGKSGSSNWFSGLFSSLLGGGGGFKPNTTLAGFLGVPGFAKGTRSSPSGWALVGENGPELTKLPGGTQVFPNNMLKSMPKLSEMQSAASLTYAPSLSISAPNAQPGVREEIAAAGKQILDQMRREFTPNVMKSLKQMKVQGLG
jgi:tape measure domain-containing protein